MPIYLGNTEIGKELVGSNQQRIVQGVTSLLNNKNHYKAMSQSHNPYGDGLASKRIVNILRSVE